MDKQGGCVFFATAPIILPLRPLWERLCTPVPALHSPHIPRQPCGIRRLIPQPVHIVMPSPPAVPSGAQLAPQTLDARVERVIGRQLHFHLVHRVDHRGVVPPAEQVADLHQWKIEQFTDQVHSYLARHR